MAVTLRNPVFQFVDSTGTPYAGGSLTFYESGTSTPLDTYNDPDLAAPHLNSNPVTFNSSGWPDVNIFLQNSLYRVVLKDSSGNTIWTRDSVSATDLASVMILKVGSGDPNGSVAGTAGSSGVLPTGYWDYTNNIEYRCTTTGNAASAVWTAQNASSATPVVVAPQGYLTISQVNDPSPIITADDTGDSTIHYMPFVGNLIPIYNGSRFIPTVFTQLTLTLNNPNHAANTIYDVFMFSNSGVLTLVTGPAWSNSTAGSCARGTGAGTTELTLLNGYYVNAVSMTARNGATTYTVGANLGTYVGSVLIDSSAGQTTCHRTWGTSRRWGVWNCYNRQPLYLKAGDSTASWNYNTATIRAANAASANSLTVFQGLAEEPYRIDFTQRVSVNSDSVAVAQIGIGWNSTTVMSGRAGTITHTSDANGGNMTVGASVSATYIQVPSIGINTVTALENAATIADGGGTMTFSGGEDDMVLSAWWRG